MFRAIPLTSFHKIVVEIRVKCVTGYTMHVDWQRQIFYKRFIIVGGCGSVGSSVPFVRRVAVLIPF